MSAAQYVAGLGLLAVVACSLAWTAVVVRRRVLPAWVGAPARLAEAVIAVALAIVLAELLGSVGEFKRWTLVAAAICVAVASTLMVRRPVSPAGAGLAAISRPSGAFPIAIAVIAVGVATSRALQSGLDALHGGMRSFDTLWYHMPFAAGFVQNASLNRLHYVGNGPTTFYPANSEVVHAIGILLFRSDVLSPIVNVVWLALALLAGWCVGRPFAVGPATMTATAAVAFLPVFGGAQAGTAGNDIVTLALLVAAVALLVNGNNGRAAVGIAATSAGLAAGTKLNAWSTVIALGAVAVVYARDDRPRTALRWTMGVLLTSGFWYLRNLVAVGNPFPWFTVRIGGLFTLPSTTAPTDCGRTSVAHYVLDPYFVSAHLVSQLPLSLGGYWWLVVGLSLAGTGAALFRREQAPLKALAVVAAVTAAGYLVTPATAGGTDASCFAFNTRFAAPALALGLILLPLALASLQLGPLVATLALATLLVLTVGSSLELGSVAAAAVVAVGVTIFASGAWRALPRPALVGGLIALGLLAVVGGRHEAQVYVRDRYLTTTFSDPIEPVERLLRPLQRTRVAVAGIAENYPLYGSHLTNEVDYPARRAGARFFAYLSCRAWLLALHDGHYDYVVTAREGTRDSPETAWTRHYPGMLMVLSSTPGTRHEGVRWNWQVFQIDPNLPVDPGAACRA